MKIILKLTALLVLISQVSVASAAALSTRPIPVSDDVQLSPWLVRLRGLAIIPDESSSTITVIGGKVSDISNAVVPELDFSYFFTPHIASELILATAKHSVKATNTALGSLNLGHVKLLPPTLTLQYHFFDQKQMVRPYIGAGINYTLFYNASSGPVASSISYDNSFGAALQAGLNVAIDDHFSINFDVKKVYIDSDVTVRALGSTMKTSVDIDPMLYSIGIGYRF